MATEDIRCQIHQLLKKEGLVNTLHAFERETGFFFDREHIATLVREGKLAKASKYLKGFIVPPTAVPAPSEANHRKENAETTQQVSLKIFHDLYLQRYLESIFHHERYEAFQILQTEMAYMLQHSNFEHYKDLVDLMSSTKIPVNILKNFVSSRDPVHWNKHANEYFIPHLFKLFDIHPQLRKVEAHKPSNFNSNTKSNTTVDMDVDKLPPARSLNVIPLNQFRNRDQPERSTFYPAGAQRISYVNPHIVEGFQFLEPKITNNIAKLAINHSGDSLALLDARGQIFTYSINLRHFSDSQQAHPGFNRGNVLPGSQANIFHSIHYSKNDQWLYSSSGGAGSLYRIEKRKNREAIASAPNNISFLRFDTDLPGSIIYGLQNGTILIQTNIDVSFQTNEHKSRILAIAKKSSILASICADGLLKVARVDGNQYFPIFQQELEGWRSSNEVFVSVALEYGVINSRSYLLISYSERIMLFDVARAVVICQTEPPPGTKFTCVVFSNNNKCVYCCTTNGDFMVFNTQQNDFLLVSHLGLSFSTTPPTSLVAHPLSTQYVFIGNSVGEVISVALALPSGLL